MMLTFQLWATEVEYSTAKPTAPVSISPTQIVSVEDYCGAVRPGQKIVLKDKRSFLVAGSHEDVMNQINSAQMEKGPVKR